ncbi:MAG TPA: hypothetical protein VHD85_16170 [Terracidiphilus sp.]|nr:hypothetical protein [Terracidiphilus sp.]
MNNKSAMPAAKHTFEEALLLGETKGYAVCAKPLRFARLPDTVATTLAELGDEGCFHVFQSEAEANKKLAQIPPEDRLGWVFSVREVAYLASVGSNDGPKLDLRGHPFQMQGFVVDSSGNVTPWRHPGRLGWRGPTAVVPPAESDHPEPGLMRKIASWLRRLVSKKAPNQSARTRSLARPV